MYSYPAASTAWIPHNQLCIIVLSWSESKVSRCCTLMFIIVQHFILAHMHWHTHEHNVHKKVESKIIMTTIDHQSFNSAWITTWSKFRLTRTNAKATQNQILNIFQLKVSLEKLLFFYKFLVLNYFTGLNWKKKKISCPLGFFYSWALYYM